LLAFGSHRDIPGNQLEGNHFPTSGGLLELERCSTADLPAIPATWTEHIETLTKELTSRYGHTRAWRLAERQSFRIGQLLEEGTLTGELLVLRHA